MAPSDLRLAARRLRRAPLFSIFAVMSLALGVGVTTAAYSLIQASTDSCTCHWRSTS